MTTICEAIIAQNNDNDNTATKNNNSKRVKVLIHHKIKMTTIYFKTMKIFENNLSGVEPYLLARAIVQLDEVGFIVSIVSIIIITIITR